MLHILLNENIKDIPTDLRTKFYQLHNRVRQSKLWDTNDRTGREVVLNDLREWLDQFRAILQLENPVTLPAKYRNELKYANNYLTDNKETGTSCSSCRTRMFNRLKKVINDEEVKIKKNNETDK